MKKISLILCMLMILTLALASCGGNESGGISGKGSDASDAADDGTRIITSLDGSSITLPAEVTKAVSLAPASTIIISALGMDAKLVDSDVSGIAALAPDVVFAPADTDVSAVESAGIPVIKIPATESVAGIKDIIRIAGKVFNAGDQAEAIITTLTNSINVIQLATASSNKYNVFLDMGDLQTTGGGTYLNEAIMSSGGSNVFSAKEGFVTVTDDEVIAANPAFIFTTSSASELSSRPGWDAIEAVANGFVYELPSSEILLPTQNITSAIQFIYETIFDAKG
jgi:ABC-type Fe3+-hydroxamate transport system, periplasmic component